MYKIKTDIYATAIGDSNSTYIWEENYFVAVVVVYR